MPLLAIVKTCTWKNNHFFLKKDKMKAQKEDVIRNDIRPTRHSRKAALRAAGEAPHPFTVYGCGKQISVSTKGDPPLR